MEPLLELELWRRLVILIPLAIVLVIAAYTDARERKVYNKLTYPAVGVGILAHGIAFGLSGFLDALLAAGATLVGGFLLFLVLPRGWLSAGDIKLMVVVAAFLGLLGLGEMLFYSVLAGGVLGLGMAAVNGYLWEMLARMGRYLRGLFRAVAYRSEMVKEELERDPRSRVPFAVAMLAGTILAYTDAAYQWPGLLALYLNALSPA